MFLYKAQLHEHKNRKKVGEKVACNCVIDAHLWKLSRWQNNFNIGLKSLLHLKNLYLYYVSFKNEIYSFNDSIDSGPKLTFKY